MRPRHLALLTLVASCVFGQSARADGSFFNAVFSRDGVDVIAVGDSGVVARSLDGGATWSSLTLGDKPLRGVVARGFTVVLVGDSGKVGRSTDSGGGWALSVMSGTPDLNAIASLSGDSLIAVGSGGTVLRSIDAGASWSAQTSGTSEPLTAVQFLDAQTGWIVGGNGFLAKSTDGGSSWTPAALGTANTLRSVAARGLTVWAVGDNATAFRSTNGGSSFAPVALHTDASPDVNKVWLSAADTVYLTGGGGFIRRSTDGGATWDFLTHSIQGQFSDLFFIGVKGWAAGRRVRAIMRTTDRGTTWLQPTGAVQSRTWALKQFFSVSVRGNTLQVNPFNKRCLYGAAGKVVYRSYDEGETWSAVSTINESGITKINAFVVSPRDSNHWVAAIGAPDHIVVTTDGGANWSDGTNSFHDFGEFGIPLEVDPDRPDSLYFGVDNGPLYWSTDGGASWSAYSNTVFRSPCDILAVPESDSSVILVGDGVTGSGPGIYWRATGGSRDFNNVWAVGGSEIPTMATSRLRNATVFGTNWANGGVQRSANSGLTWPSVHTVISAWGIDIPRDDPSMVMFGVFSGTTVYTSFANGDSGSFAALPLTGSNYALMLRDRGLALALQSNGIYKLSMNQTLPNTTAQNLTVTAPNGGESWAPGGVHGITWSSTNVALARIEYRAHPEDPWQLVALEDGPRGTHAWTVPYDATTEASIRVSDAWDASPSDVSDQTFTIPLPLVAELPSSLAFGTRPIGSATLDTVRITNTGSDMLQIGSITTAGAAYQPGRSSLSLSPGASDTVGVTFRPSASASYPDTLVISSNAWNAGTIRVPLAGAGTDTPMLSLTSPDGGETWQYGTTHSIAWQSALVSAVDMEFKTALTGAWTSIADSVPANVGSYAWLIPDAPSTQCRLRIREHGGPVHDSSQATFSITVPSYVEAPGSLFVGTTIVNSAITDTIHIENSGTAPLAISSVISSDPRFWPGRTSFVIPAGGSDSLGISYRPTAVGTDSATLTLAADDPFAPHLVQVSGHSVLDVGTGDAPPPARFALWQNQPNPFTGRTLIRYALPIASHATLEVFDIQGNRVATLVDGVQPPGVYGVSFGPRAMTVDGRRLGSLAPGVYLYRFRASGFGATRKMVMMR